MAHSPIGLTDTAVQQAAYELQRVDILIRVCELFERFIRERVTIDATNTQRMNDMFTILNGCENINEQQQGWLVAHCRNYESTALIDTLMVTLKLIAASANVEVDELTRRVIAQAIGGTAGGYWYKCGRCSESFFLYFNDQPKRLRYSSTSLSSNL
jgi:hypothetical protein